MCISAFLRPHEAVIAAASGHVCVHETGAIEASGHKCIALPAAPGASSPRPPCGSGRRPPGRALVKPRLVYISNTTETGGVYSLKELEALRAACDELGLLFVSRRRAPFQRPGRRRGGPGRSGPPVRRLYIGGTKTARSSARRCAS